MRPVNNHTFRFVLFLMVLAGCVLLGRVFSFDVPRIREWLAQFPLMISGALFVICYVGITTFIWLGPKDVLRVVAAVLFGPIVSTLFIAVGESANAAILFHLSRNLGREFVIKNFKLNRSGVDRVRNSSGILSIVALRLNPVLPFRFLDLGYGLSGIDFQRYIYVVVGVSWLRILWLQTILAGLGAAVIDPNRIVDYLLNNQQIMILSAVYFSIVVLLSAAAFLERKFSAKNVL